jgi:uncharacterized protein involved in tolerance to divalent cations
MGKTYKFGIVRRSFSNIKRHSIRKKNIRRQKRCHFVFYTTRKYYSPCKYIQHLYNNTKWNNIDFNTFNSTYSWNKEISTNKNENPFVKQWKRRQEYGKQKLLNRHKMQYNRINDFYGF